MNSEHILQALDHVDGDYIEQAGQIGGYYRRRQAAHRPRILGKVLLAAAVILLLVGGVFGAKVLIGIWNDRWLTTPCSDPCAVVQEAIERQNEKEYTLSVQFEQVELDEIEKEKVLSGSMDSVLAKQNGYGANCERLVGEDAENVAAVCARYTVIYDHSKTYYPDGNMLQYFYLLKNGDGAWEIFDSSSPILLEKDADTAARPNLPSIHEDEEQAPVPSGSEPAAASEGPAEDYAEAVEVIVEMVKQWESFDDVDHIEILRAEYDAAQTQRALDALSANRMAAQQGWTLDYLKEHMAAVTVEYTTYPAPDPQIPDAQPYTETATYWLLQDPDTGLWQNSPITGLMDG